MSESEEISRAEFARRVRVSRAAVTIAANEGRFTAEAMSGKKLRLPLALEQWKANKRGDFEAEDDADDADEAKIAPAGSVAGEKLLTYRARREKIELENAVTRGELIARDRVLAGLQDAGAAIAAELDAIATWAEDLAAIAAGDVAGMRAALKAKARSLRERLAEHLDKAPADGERDDDAGE